MAAATRRSSRLSAKASSATDALHAPAPTLAAPAPSTGKRKASAINGEEHPPATPPKRKSVRTATATARPPPGTPTPDAAGLMAESTVAAAAVPETPKPKPRAVSRLADPNATQATLISPESSRIVRSRAAAASEVSVSVSASASSSPSKPSGPGAGGEKPGKNVLEEACRHLVAADARMKPLIEQHHCHLFSPEGLAETVDPFEALASGIISQQVSGAAATSIKAKFVALFADDPTSAACRFPAPSAVVACPIERLRSAGLSQRKAEYVQGLAAKFASGELGAALLADAPYEDVVERLTAVRGLGLWSVEMFACFALKRPDVFSLGDLGVQRGMAAFVGRDVRKLKSRGGKWKYMSEREMREISARFAPYRSVFMWYMWRVEMTDVSTLE